MVAPLVAGKEKTRVLVVDDHPLFREGLMMVLNHQPDFEVTAQGERSDDALQAIATNSIDLAVLDILLPGSDGIAVARGLRERAPGLAIVGLSLVDEPMRVAQMLRAGARGFIHKTQPSDEIVGAIRATVAGQRYIWPQLHGAVDGLLAEDAKLPMEQLTPREREVFLLLVRGYSNERSATQLGIAPRTVETHRQRVMKKLGAHSVAELVRLAARWGTPL